MRYVLFACLLELESLLSPHSAKTSSNLNDVNPVYTNVTCTTCLMHTLKLVKHTDIWLFNTFFLCL